MNPLLKRHIEMNIDDIEKGNLTNSIIYCPLDIMDEYLDALRRIDEVIPGHLIPFTRIASYLASVFKGGQLYKMTIRNISNETYHFEFPYSGNKIDFLKVRQGLTDCWKFAYITCDIATDFTNNIISIKVSTTPINFNF